MTNFKFNANHFVKVKLTDKGVGILKSKHDELNNHINSRGGKPFGEFELKIDDEGCYSCQLWQLMHDFGEHTYIGFDQPFGLDIIFVDGEEI